MIEALGYVNKLPKDFFLKFGDDKKKNTFTHQVCISQKELYYQVSMFKHFPYISLLTLHFTTDYTLYDCVCDK